MCLSFDTSPFYFAILSSGETGSRTYTFTEYHKTAND